jgi:uncharacterized protein YgiM (DUF1202 family)
MVRVFIIFLFLFASTIYAGEESHSSQNITIEASRLNVRDIEGRRLCTVKAGRTYKVLTQRDNGEYVKIDLSESQRCRGITDGWVNSRYISTTNRTNKDFVVNVSSLSLRSAASRNSDTWECGLEEGTKVLVTKVRRGSWRKIKLKESIDGCPQEGWVYGSFINSDETFTDLPRESNTQLEAGTAECANCGQDNNAKIIKEVVSKLHDKDSNTVGEEDSENESSPLVEELQALVKGKKYRPSNFTKARGLIRLPLLGKKYFTQGPCGSHHYTGGHKNGDDAYANPITACTFLSVLRDWKKDYCSEDDKGCRVAWGDISHRYLTGEAFGHSSHNEGKCIDIRPFRIGKFKPEGLYFNRGEDYKRPKQPRHNKKHKGKRRRRRKEYVQEQLINLISRDVASVKKGGLNPEYDRDTTTKFVNLLKEKGATTIYFNDTATGAKPYEGHSNHIHVCFDKNAKAENACKNLKLEPNICPGLN